MMLRQNGYNVLTAADGADALSIYAAHADAGHADQIKVIVTDTAMPRLNGIALIRALKQMNSAVPIIASTGMAEEIHRDQLTKQGVNLILQKPYVAEKLLIALHGVLHREYQPTAGA
jgi:CheY-like chemotaxis protein